VNSSEPLHIDIFIHIYCRVICSKFYTRKNIKNHNAVLICTCDTYIKHGCEHSGVWGWHNKPEHVLSWFWKKCLPFPVLNISAFFENLAQEAKLDPDKPVVMKNSIHARKTIMRRNKTRKFERRKSSSKYFYLHKLLSVCLCDLIKSVASFLKYRVIFSYNKIFQIAVFQNMFSLASKQQKHLSKTNHLCTQFIFSHWY
jgi:hypothetical protein